MSGPARRTRERSQVERFESLQLRMRTRSNRRLGLALHTRVLEARVDAETNGNVTPYFSLISPNSTEVTNPERELNRSIVDLTCDADIRDPQARAYTPFEDDEVLIVSENIRTNYSPVILEEIPALSLNRGASVIVANSFGGRSSPAPFVQGAVAAVSKEVPDAARDTAAKNVFTFRPTDATDDERILVQCPICLDTLKQMREAGKATYVTSCGHVFCKPCIDEVILTIKACPTCRKRLRAKDAHPLFL